MLKKANTRKKLQRVDVQVSVFTAIVAILSCFIVSFLYYKVTHYDMLRSLEDRVYSIRSFIVNNVDASAYTDINTPEDMNTDLYERTHSIFKNVQDVTGVMYLYSGKRNADGELIYVVDCIDPSASDFRHPGDTIEPEIVPEMEKALRGEEVMPHNIKNTDWGKIFIAYLPVRVNEEIVGVIGVEFEADHQFNTYHDLLIISPFVAFVICIISVFVAKALFRRISNPLYKDMINTDHLTNLKSRNAFEVDIKNLNAGKNHNGIGIYVIDLNNLKLVNDTLGHESGDIYLQTAAQAFCDCAGDNYSIYRIGGDEFVLISKEDTLQKMSGLSQKMIDRFDEIKPVWDMNLSFSIGYALFDPATDSQLMDVYKRADQRMYERKHEFHAKIQG